MYEVLDGLYRNNYDPCGVYRDKDGRAVDGSIEPLRTKIYEAYARMEKEHREALDRRLKEEEKRREELRVFMSRYTLVNDEWAQGCYNDILDLIEDYGE